MILTICAAAALTLAAVGIHFEFLRLASWAVERKAVTARLKVAVAVLLALVAHLLEASVFALGWGGLDHTGHAALSVTHPGVADTFYFSLITYTSLGYGDIVPLGPSRVLAGVESLVGLVLIAWTASFTFYQMRRHWGEAMRG